MMGTNYCSKKMKKKKKHIEKAKTTRTSHKQRKVACMPITHLNLSLSLSVQLHNAIEATRFKQKTKPPIYKNKKQKKP